MKFVGTMASVLIALNGLLMGCVKPTGESLETSPQPPIPGTFTKTGVLSHLEANCPVVPSELTLDRQLQTYAESGLSSDEVAKSICSRIS